MRRDKFFNELASIQQHNITPTIAAFLRAAKYLMGPADVFADVKR